MTQKDIVLKVCRDIVDGKLPQPRPFEVVVRPLEQEAYNIRYRGQFIDSISVTHTASLAFMRILGLPEPLEWVESCNEWIATFNGIISFKIRKMEDWMIEDGKYLYVNPYAMGELINDAIMENFSTLEEAQSAAYWWLVELRNPKKP